MIREIIEKIMARCEKITRKALRESHKVDKNQINNKIIVIVSILVGIFTIKDVLAPLHIAGMDASSFLIKMSGMSIAYIFIAALLLADIMPESVRVLWYQLSEWCYYLTIFAWIISGTLIMIAFSLNDFYMMVMWFLVLIVEIITLPLLPFMGYIEKRIKKVWSS